MWSLYLIDVLSSIDGLIHIVAAVVLIGLIVGLSFSFAGWAGDQPEYVPRGFWIAKQSCFALVPIFFLAILIPSKTTLYAMLAADAGEKIVQSKEFKEIGGKALEALNKKLDELDGKKPAP